VSALTPGKLEMTFASGCSANAASASAASSSALCHAASSNLSSASAWRPIAASTSCGWRKWG